MSDGSDRDNVIRVGFGADGKLERRTSERSPASSYPAPPSEDPSDPLAGLYTLAQVARLFGYTPSRLRYWHRSGFLRASARHGGRNYYTFRDLLSVRAAKALLEQGVPLQQVRRTVDSLRQSFPTSDRPLADVNVKAEGRTVVVEDDVGTYEPTTGQSILNFRLETLQSDVVKMLDHKPDDRSRAYECYLEGCQLDEDPTTLDAAEQAYKRALAFDPTLSNALTNLGNLNYRRNRLDEAEDYYHQALRSDPEQPEALYNLGFLHFERDDLDSAIVLFRQALGSDPSFGDAHFNLAMALEERGDVEGARAHWKQYLTLEPTGSWADIARRHLGEAPVP